MHRGRTLGGLLILALLLALVHLVGLAHEHWRVLDGALLGPDSYMRMVRVQRLHDTGDWYDSRLPRANAPRGEVLHWTRPFDLLLLAGAALLTPALGFASGLHLTAVLVGPLLHFLTLLLLLWGARGLLARPALVAMAVMFLFQASISSQFLAGRPDHHGLQALLFTALMGATLRLLAVPRAGLATVAGLIAAGAIWVSVEGLLVAAAVMLTLALAWIVGGRRYLSAGLGFALAAVAGLTVALIVERPPSGWLVEAYDRISVVHLAAFVALAVPWLAFRLLDRRIGWPASLRLRALSVLVCGSLAAAALWAFYPKFFAGPMVDVAPRVRALWLPQISEMMTIVGQPSLGQAFYLLLLYLGAALPAALYMLWLIRRRQGLARALWSFLAGLTLLYLALALVQLRWGIYAQIAALPAYGHLLCRVFQRLGLALTAGPARGWRGVLRVTGGRLAVLLVFALGFPAAALLARWSASAETTAATEAAGTTALTATAIERTCDVAAVARVLSRRNGLGRHARLIVTYIFDGPEILYRTPHAVVATPYHGNGAGILDTYDIFAATDPGAARRILMRRGVDWLLICPRGSERLFYAREGEDTLLEQLIRGDVPDWLRPLALPAAVADEYKLYEVRP